MGETWVQKRMVTYSHWPTSAMLATRASYCDHAFFWRNGATYLILRIIHFLEETIVFQLAFV